MIALSISLASLALTALVLGRLHLLSTSLSALRASLDSKHSGEITYLRKQVEGLQQQVLALTAPSAQARLKAQEQREAHGPAEVVAISGGKARVLPTLSARRNPMVIDIPDRMNEAGAFDEGDEAESDSPSESLR